MTLYQYSTHVLHYQNTKNFIKNIYSPSFPPLRTKWINRLLHKLVNIDSSQHWQNYWLMFQMFLLDSSLLCMINIVFQDFLLCSFQWHILKYSIWHFLNSQISIFVLSVVIFSLMQILSQCTAMEHIQTSQSPTAGLEPKRIISTYYWYVTLHW